MSRTVSVSIVIMFFFFFQAEDGIRDLYVTGVQTCALPIFEQPDRPARPQRIERIPLAIVYMISAGRSGCSTRSDTHALLDEERRSEERRVGKECRSRCSAYA